MSISSVEEIIEEIRQGRMVILMDDPERENEGDLIMSAAHVTASDINFMVTYARGLVCMPMDEDICKRLELPPMAANNESRFHTQFTVSIEAKEGVTTGISAADRAKTIQTAAAPHATAADLVRPGHIFPIMARKGGVLARPGHTEAVCDLMVLAGLNPVGVLIEIMNEDGTMARRPELEQFAKQHQLKIGTIADLIEYRRTHTGV